MPDGAPPKTFEVVLADGSRSRIGREDYWRGTVEPAMRSAWNEPQRLYPMVLRALEDGFAIDLLPFAEQLFRLAHGLEIGGLVLGEVQRKAGRLDAGEQTLRAQLARTGPSALLLLNLAKIEGDRGRTENELSLLRDSLQLDPNGEDALALWRAIHLERFGSDAALRALDEVARLPGAWRPQMWLGRMAQERGDTQAAVELFHYAVTKSGFERSCVLMAVGSLSAADGIHALRDYDPLSGSAHTGFLLVELLSNTGRKHEASSLLRTIESRAASGMTEPRASDLDGAIVEHAQALRARLGLSRQPKL